TTTVLTEVDRRGVATVTLNRPEVNNAYNGELILGLIDAFTRLGRDPNTRVVLIRGNGRHFQAGADLKWIQSISGLSAEENLQVSMNTTNAIRGLNEFPKPTIALVHGGCFGGGVGLVASCDIVLASEDAIFSITETRWGLMAATIIPQLNARMGLANVRRYALTSERFDARRAQELGLVSEVCATGGLDAAAAPIIDALLMCGPEAIAETKACALEAAGQVIDDAYAERLARQHAAKRMTPEGAEGLASFVEKRKPRWYTGDA